MEVEADNFCISLWTVVLYYIALCRNSLAYTWIFGALLESQHFSHLDLTLLLLTLTLRVLQKALWNPIWAARASRHTSVKIWLELHFRPPPNVVWIWFSIIRFHVFFCCYCFSVLRNSNAIHLLCQHMKFCPFQNISLEAKAFWIVESQRAWKACP